MMFDSYAESNYLLITPVTCRRLIWNRLVHYVGLSQFRSSQLVIQEASADPLSFVL